MFNILTYSFGNIIEIPKVFLKRFNLRNCSIHLIQIIIKREYLFSYPDIFYFDVFILLDEESAVREIICNIIKRCNENVE